MLIIIKTDSTSCFKTTATGQDGTALRRHGVAHIVCSSLMFECEKSVLCTGLNVLSIPAYCIYIFIRCFFFLSAQNLNFTFNVFN